jgi:hypothetical protein
LIIAAASGKFGNLLGLSIFLEVYRRLMEHKHLRIREDFIIMSVNVGFDEISNFCTWLFFSTLIFEKD